MTTATTAWWRDDLDALAFAVVADDRDHGAPCMIHRRAFRALTGQNPVGQEDCLAFFSAHAVAFEKAAWEKITRQSIPHGRSLNLNSRDIRRAIGSLAPADGDGAGRACRALAR